MLVEFGFLSSNGILRGEWWKGDIRNCREHALVDGNQQIRNPGASNAGLIKHISEADIGEVTNVRVGSVGEGEGISPEEPLEGDDANGHA